MGIYYKFACLFGGFINVTVSSFFLKFIFSSFLTLKDEIMINRCSQYRFLSKINEHNYKEHRKRIELTKR